MANFWAGFGQGFVPAFQQSLQRSDRRRERKEDRQQRLDDLAAARKLQERDLAESRQYTERQNNELQARVDKISREKMLGTLLSYDPSVVENAVQRVGGGVPKDAWGMPDETMRTTNPQDLGRAELHGASAFAHRNQSAKDTTAKEYATAKKERAITAGRAWAAGGRSGDVPSWLGDKHRLAFDQAADEYDTEITSAREVAAAGAGGKKSVNVDELATGTAGYMYSIWGNSKGQELIDNIKDFHKVKDNNGNMVDAIDKATGKPTWKVYMASASHSNEMKELAGLYDRYIGVFGKAPENVEGWIPGQNSQATIHRLRAEIEKNGGDADIRAVAKHYQRHHPSHFTYTDADGKNQTIDVKTESPAVLAEINKKVFKDSSASKTSSQSMRAAIEAGTMTVDFLKLKESIETKRANGESISDTELDKLEAWGATLTSFYSTREIWPASLKEHLANAPKRPTAKPLYEVIVAHETALLAEELRDDVLFLERVLGPKEMIDLVGMIDAPIADLRTKLGVKFGENQKAITALNRFHQRAAQLRNRTLKLRSGAAVTESEAERFMQEFADVKREDYFNRIKAFATISRNTSRSALKAYQDAGYEFHNKLVKEIGSSEASSTSKTLPNLTGDERSELQKLNAMNRDLMDEKQVNRFRELLRKAAKGDK